MKKYIIIGVVIVVVIGGVYVAYQRYLASLIRTTPLVDTTISSSTTYTLADIATHTTTTSCWTTVADKVYDLTTFIVSHPGGKAMLPACGTDGNALFTSVREHYRGNAQAILDMYLIGKLTQ